MQTLIRQAIASDSHLLSNLSVKTFYQTYEAFNSAEDMEKYTGEYFNRDLIEEEITGNIQTYFIGFINYVASGYATLKSSRPPLKIKPGKTAEVGRIYVLNEFKNKGLGKALLNHCIDKAKEEGFDHLWLGVWQKNQPAIDFYEKCGFSKMGVQTFILGNDPQDDWIMVRPL